MIHRLRARLRSERGQVLILFVGIFTIICVAGAIAVDFGLWFSERRGAQTDADLSSLAGAFEYELCLDPAAACADPDGNASTAASDWFDLNNEAGNASLPRPIEAPSPHGSNRNCVKVWAEHDTKALFTSIFGLGPEDIGASAKACAGAITGTTGVLPIEMATTNDPCFLNGEPQYTSLCLLESGAGSCPAAAGFAGEPVRRAPGGTPGRPPTHTPAPTRTPRRTVPPTPTFTPGPTPTPAAPQCNPHGILDLEADGNYCSDSGGPPSIEELITFGADGICRVNEVGACDPDHNGPWYDCVAVQTGNTAEVIDGFLARLARQGACDTDGDGVESFGETVTIVVDSGDPRTSLYEARVCPGTGGQVSPRIITIIILGSNPPPGNVGHPILGFAAFYLGGCYDDRSASPPASVDDLDQNCDGGIPPGHIAIYGQFLKLTVTNGDVGDPNGNPGTLFGIALVE